MDNNPASRDMAEFLAKHFPRVNQLCSAEFYDWKNYGSPFGQGRIALEMIDGEVAATASLSIKPLIVGDIETVGAEIGDTFTHPEHQRKGLFSKMVRACVAHAAENGVAPIYGTPNGQSLPGYENKLGFPRCRNARVKDMFKEIDRRFLIAKAAAKLGSKALAAILGNAYWLAREARKKLGGWRAAPVEWREVAAFPSGLDPRWADDRKDYAFFIGRDAAYLNWRFQQNPNDYRMFLGLVGGVARCYFVTKLVGRGSHFIGYLCDYACWNDDMALFRAVLDMAEQTLARDKAKGVELYCSANSPYMGLVRRAGYRPIGEVVVIAEGGSAPGRTLIESTRKWHFTMADADGV